MNPAGPKRKLPHKLVFDFPESRPRWYHYALRKLLLSLLISFIAMCIMSAVGMAIVSWLAE